MTDTQNLLSDREFEELTKLWQDGGDIPVEPLIDQLKKQNQKLRRLNVISFAVCLGALLITVVLELVGEIPTRGLLSLAGLALVVGSWWKYRRDKARLIAAYSEEPHRLLPFLIKRTRAARNLGRYYYMSGLPSVAAGFFIGRFTGTDSEGGTLTPLLAVLVSIGLLLIVAVTVWGVRLARQKTAELRELEALAAKLEAEGGSFEDIEKE